MFITQAELAEHRADAEARMGAANGGSDVRIRRRAGRGPQGGDGREAPAWATTYAWLPARLAGRRGASTSSTDRSGDVEVQRAMRTLSLPATWLHPGEEQPRRLDVDDGDLIEVLAGENAGQVVRVDEADWQDQATALRLPVIAADRPLEWDEGGRVKISVQHTLADLERDARAVPRKAVVDMRDAVRGSTIEGNKLARANARRTAGRHGKLYPRSFTWEMRGSLFGAAGFTGEYGPLPGRQQGRMSFEYGSRNQPPHLDLNKSADVIGPKFGDDVGRKMDGWFW